MSAPLTHIGPDGRVYPTARYASYADRAAAIRLSWGDPAPAADDAPACSVCGDYLEGDRESGAYCPTCDRNASWRYA